MASLLTHRRSYGYHVPPPAAVAYPYPTEGLLLYADTSFSSRLSASYVLNGSGQVTTFANQAPAGGPSLVASAPLALVADGDAPYVLMQNGSLTAAFSATQQAPFTLVAVLKNLPAEHIEYQIWAALSSNISGHYARCFIKNDLAVLVGDDNSYTDIASVYPVNQNGFVLWKSADAMRDYGSFTNTYRYYDNIVSNGGPIDSFFKNKPYEELVNNPGNYGIKLLLLYNRPLTDSEASAIRDTIFARYTF